MVSKDIVGLLESFLSRCRSGLVQLPITLIWAQDDQRVCSIPEVEMPNLGSSKVIWGYLQERFRLEFQSHSLLIGTNWVLRVVGSRYEAFVEVGPSSRFVVRAH